MGHKDLLVTRTYRRYRKLSTVRTRSVCRKASFKRRSHQSINRPLEIKKSVGVYAGLLQDRTERSFGHVTWVIGDRRIAIIAGVVPDLMATRSLSIKLESTKP